MSDYLPNATRYVPTRQYYPDTAPHSQQDAITETVHFVLDLLIPLFFISAAIFTVVAVTSIPGAGVLALLLWLSAVFSIAFRTKIL